MFGLAGRTASAAPAGRRHGQAKSDDFVLTTRRTVPGRYLRVGEEQHPGRVRGRRGKGFGPWVVSFAFMGLQRSEEGSLTCITSSKNGGYKNIKGTSKIFNEDTIFREREKKAANQTPPISPIFTGPVFSRCTLLPGIAQVEGVIAAAPASPCA